MQINLNSNNSKCYQHPKHHHLLPQTKEENCVISHSNHRKITCLLNIQKFIKENIMLVFSGMANNAFLL